LSTQPLQPAWKQEVNQRLAAHKNRKGAPGSASQKPEAPKPGASRAAEAAARVAERYAKAKSYTQMQAEEARAAVRAAEIATQVAIEAQAVAHSALAELHAAAEQPMRGPAVVESIQRPPRVEEPAAEPIFDWTQEPAENSAAKSSAQEPHAASRQPSAALREESPIVTQEVVDGRSFNLRWEPDLPARPVQMLAPTRAQEEFELSAEDWWTPARVIATLHGEPIEVDAQQSHANLIEFPRELVAARKMRPRLAEAAAGVAVEHDPQLSIFEVDPGTISFEPMPAPLSEPSNTAWSGPVWSGMELDAHPAREEAPRAEASAQHGLHLAPIGLRLLAMVIDGSLILGSFFAAAMWMASKMTHVPGPKAAELMAVAGLLLTGFAYHALFFAWSNMTPGMRYAGVALCTFDDGVPTRDQLRRRLAAMAVSLLPVGLGMVWSVFDEDHLSWHDRLSETYLRKR